MESGIDTLHIFTGKVQEDASVVDLHWLAYVLKRDLDDAIAWHGAAHVETKDTGPVAVT